MEPFLVLRGDTIDQEPERIAGKESEQFKKAKEWRQKVRDRLEDEGEWELAEKIGKCGDPITLHCTGCGHIHSAERRCSLKWCPVCQRKRATQRALRYERAAAEMAWPMHITLTRRNVSDIDATDIKSLQKALKKLRRQAIWKHNVVGGIASLELTNTGKGWHPHLHILADCEWLAVETPRPKRYHSRATKKHLFQQAAAELERAWSACIGQLVSSVKVRRCDGATAVREVLKYAVKGSDLADSPDLIGPAIRAISESRLCTPFGSLYGKKLLTAAEKKPPCACPSCHQYGTWMPDSIVQAIVISTRRGR